MSSQTILVVDDNTADREIVSIACKPLVDQVQSTADPLKVLDIYKESQPDLVLIDYRMEPLSGLEVSDQLMEYDHNANCVMMTGQPDAELLDHLTKHGLPDIIPKPFKLLNFRDQVQSALRRLRSNELSSNDIALANRMDRCLALLGESSEITSIRKQISAYLKNPKGLVIQSIKGFGKLELSQFIHDNLSDQEAPLLTFDCRCLDTEVLSRKVISENGVLGQLFAKSERRGTLVISNIHCLPPEQQILFAGELRSLSRSMHLIFTTDESVDELLMNGMLTNELYFALPPLHLDIPSLAHRPMDTEAIVRSILQSNSSGIKFPKLSSTEIDYLVADLRLNHSPENVEELISYLRQYPANSLPNQISEPKRRVRV